MDRKRLDIDPDIRRASTLPSGCYADAAFQQDVRERIFARSWQLVADTGRLKVPGQVLPFTLLEGCLDEPLLLTRDGRDALHCLSNVCTHRGNLVSEGEAVLPGLRCRYHGRRFGLDGRFQSMPEFEDVEGFPSEADHLPRVPFGRWKTLLFASVDPAFPFEALLEETLPVLDWLPLEEFAFDPARSRDYLVKAHWALYCENYLEGFHIPYVHAGLTGPLDYGRYRTELFRYASLQVGIANPGEDAFELPLSSPHHGERIGAYYLWLFPNTMLNFYPWGLSVNIVKPVGPDRSRVAFRSYVHDAARLSSGAGAELDRVEREDESVVESVQKGVRSRFYGRGRYSPKRETGVHHFHRLLAEFLADGG